MAINWDEIKRLRDAATQTPWVIGDNWARAGELPKFGDGRCFYCLTMGAPARITRERIHGRKLEPLHWHKIAEPHSIDHQIETADGTETIAGNYATEEGGIIRSEDTAYIAATCPAVMAEIIAEREALLAQIAVMKWEVD